VHKEDPLHPIVYAAAATRDLPDLKTFVPSLDIVGVNVYGSFNQVLGWMASEKYDRPVVATEFGPYGEWDGMKDANGQPFDPTDHIKAANYVSLWREIEKVTGKSLGGFAFVLGEQRNQASLTWYNINLGEKKRQSYWALTQAYTGQALKNRCPKIRFMKADRVNHLKPGDFINIELTASDPDGDKTTTKYFITDIATDPLIVQPARTYPTQTEIRSDGKAMMQVPHEPGIYRAYATVEDPEGFIAVANVSLKVEGITDSSH
jgi:hypothetical protein